MDRMDEIITDREAPQGMVEWFCEQAVEDRGAPRMWFRGAMRGQRVLCSCSCGETQCLKIVSLSTVRQCIQQKPRTDPFACPAHEHEGTYSPGHKTFFDEVKRYMYRGPFIWEWVDCPGGGNKMHWDVTLRAGDRAARYEIDSEYHIRPTRRHSDIIKDDIVLNAGVSLMRMHVADVEIWGSTAYEFAREQRRGVFFSESYHDMLTSVQRRRIISG